MTLNNSTRIRQRPSNNQTEIAAAAAIVPDEQSESTMTNEERIAQLKQQVCSNRSVSN
jgi:anti-sigma28 factor (negative regulator of flagellin synthesis)